MVKNKTKQKLPGCLLKFKSKNRDILLSKLIQTKTLSCECGVAGPQFHEVWTWQHQVSCSFADKTPARMRWGQERQSKMKVAAPPLMMACNELFKVFQQRAIKVSSLPLNSANTLLIPIEMSRIQQKRQVRTSPVTAEIQVVSSLILLYLIFSTMLSRYSLQKCMFFAMTT